MYIINKDNIEIGKEKFLQHISTCWINRKFKVIGSNRAHEYEVANLKFSQLYVDYKIKKNDKVLICNKEYLDKKDSLLKSINKKNIVLEDSNYIYYNPLKDIKNKNDLMVFSNLFYESSFIFKKTEIAKNIVFGLFLLAYKNNKLTNLKELFNYFLTLIDFKILNADVKDIILEEMKINLNNIDITNDIEIVCEKLYECARCYNDKKIKDKVNVKRFKNNINCYYDFDEVSALFFIRNFLIVNNNFSFISIEHDSYIPYYEALFLCSENKEEVFEKIWKEYNSKSHSRIYRLQKSYGKEYHGLVCDRKNHMIPPPEHICLILENMDNRNNSKQKLICDNLS